jgi:hypothetical protein
MRSGKHRKLRQERHNLSDTYAAPDGAWNSNHFIGNYKDGAPPELVASLIC